MVMLISILLICFVVWCIWMQTIPPSSVEPDKIEMLLQKAEFKVHLRQDMLAKIRQYIESQHFHSETERIDFIRDWVYRNSIHKIDAEHDEYAFDTPRVLFMLWRSHQTSKDYPHLSCGPRMNVMKAILENLRIPNREIMIFDNDYLEIYGHIFLDVFDRQTRNWEVEDPDFDISYIDIRNRKRLSAAGLIWDDLNSVVPISPTQEGWESNHVSHLKRDYLGAMMFVNVLDGTKSVISINLDRFSADKFFKEDEVTSLYKYACTHYDYPIFITGHTHKFGNWDENSFKAITAYFSGPDESVPHPHFE